MNQPENKHSALATKYKTLMNTDLSSQILLHKYNITAFLKTHDCCQRVTVSVTAANNNHQITVTWVLITRTCNLSSALPISTTRSLTLIVRSTVHYPEQYLTLFYLTCDLLTLLSPRSPPAMLQCVSCFPVLPSSTIPEKETLISSLPCHIGLDHHTSHAPAPLTSHNSTCQ